MFSRSRHKSVLTVILVGGSLVVAVLAGWWAARHSSESGPLGIALSDQVQPPSIKSMVHLYFGDDQGLHLVAERRVLEKPPDAAAFGKLLIEALIQGPAHGSRTLPEDARLDAIYISPAGVAYLDFAAGAFAGHPGGVGAELLSIYSIVNTLVLNVDGIRAVKFLIGGREAATMAGHADLRSPFEVDMLWVR